LFKGEEKKLTLTNGGINHCFKKIVLFLFSSFLWITTRKRLKKKSTRKRNLK